MQTINIEIGPSINFKEYKKSLFISFDYSLEAVNAVKSLDLRYYIPDKKSWEVPVNDIQKVIKKFESFEIKITGEVKTDLKDNEKEKHIDYTEEDLKDFQFKTKPFKHQIEGVVFGKRNPKFLLADDQGLGKTKMMIDLAVSRKHEFKHCLVVCGVNSVKFNWLKEIETHSNESAHILGSYYNSKGHLKDDGSLQDRLDDLESDLSEFFLITNIETFRQPPKNKKESSMSKTELVQKRLLDRVEQLTEYGTIGMVVI